MPSRAEYLPKLPQAAAETLSGVGHNRDRRHASASVSSAKTSHAQAGMVPLA